MLPRERVNRVLMHQQPDRIPVYGWVSANLENVISRRFGSVENFEDKYEFDYAHLFGNSSPYPMEQIEKMKIENGGEIRPDELLEIQLSNPDDEGIYKSIIEGVNHHKEKRGRFVYVQTPGIFECLNEPFGMENHLVYLALCKDELHEVYRRQAEWNRRFASNCLDLGVDMIHVSDDWGAQRGLIFSPDTWWEMIYPYHKVTCDEVKRRNAFLSLHSDGNISRIMDGVVKLGYDVVHPYQESAGMDLKNYFQRYRDEFIIMGGLDVQTTIGFNKYEHLENEIRRVINLFTDKCLLFCTTHFIQSHCTIDELVFAFDTIYQAVRG